MNSINIIGRITKDIEIFKDTIGKISIAVPREYKNIDGNYDTDFFDVVVFNVSDYLKDRLKKGTLISVVGRLQNNTYEKEGKKHSTTNIIANKIQILSKQENPPKTEENNPYKEFSAKTESSIGEQIQIEDSDLPF